MKIKPPPEDPWVLTNHRDDLKGCPFCGTVAIEQKRESTFKSGELLVVWRIQCGNPLCTVVCCTWESASRENAEKVWQERVG